jgi:hypothetical protein
MSGQNSYDLRQASGYAGQVYSDAPKDIITRAVETAAGIDFGVAVSQGAADDQATLGGTAYLGVSIRSLDQEGAANTGAIKWDETEAMGILRTGYIYAVCPTGCVPMDAVKFTNTTGALDSGVAGVGETQLNGGTWQYTAAAGEIGVIRLESTLTTAGS